MSYRAINYKDYLVYLVESDIEQSNNDIIISKELYDEMLQANQEKYAEIRVIELEDESLSIRDFYDRKPSNLHVWNRKTQQFEISDQDYQQLKTEENIAFLVSESERTEDEIKVYKRMRDRNRADTDDLAVLEVLEDYSIDLKKVTKQKGWPLEAEWPVAPEFF